MCCGQGGVGQPEHAEVLRLHALLLADRQRPRAALPAHPHHRGPLRSARRLLVRLTTRGLPLLASQAGCHHLSAARAVAVVRYLIRTSNSVKPIPVDRFESVPFGESRPLVANIGELNRRRNRRIEIQFYRRPNANEWEQTANSMP